ncbi:hypothetical protein Gogos_013026 [Gossypium gossypioides]|uniref:Strictosidine synthase conserved region domain-containing protein n=1 Tax=Gossypium gossypioides TaxID=34282 RepID=A0A7J9BUC3_GOSGO|nr:hypothetical protein [Gossypium gossypioides]
MIMNSFKFLFVMFCFAFIKQSYQSRTVIPKSYNQFNLTDVAGPESIAFDCKGEGPYVSVCDDKILKHEPNFGWKEFAIPSLTKYADLLSRSSTDQTGRLLRYDPRAKRASVMYKGLMFSNGVVLSQNRSFLLVAETIRKRILKFNLEDVNGLNNNKLKVFVELPRVPDNIKMNEKGEFWVALNTGRLGETSNDGSDPIGVKYGGDKVLFYKNWRGIEELYLILLVK